MKHIALSEFSSDNYRLYVEKPDKDFSEQKNHSVINQVLAENDKMQIQLNKQVEKNAENVADILSSFAKYKLDQGGSKQIETWLGKVWMEKIYGQKLLDKIKRIEMIKAENRKNGNTKFEDYYLV